MRRFGSVVSLGLASCIAEMMGYRVHGFGSAIPRERVKSPKSKTKSQVKKLAAKKSQKTARKITKENRK